MTEPFDYTCPFCRMKARSENGVWRCGCVHETVIWFSKTANTADFVVDMSQYMTTTTPLKVPPKDRS